MKSKPAKSKLLKQVGLWATIWWACSGLYIAFVVWLAKDYYVQKIGGGYTGGALSAWAWSSGQAYSNHAILQWLLAIIVLGWIIGGLVWLKALKQTGISYRSGLKDLFLTLR